MLVRHKRHREQVKQKIEMVTVFVSNLLDDMDEIWLKQLFRKYGEVHDVFIPRKHTVKTNYRFGFIHFSSKSEALASIENLNRMIIREARIVVKLAKFNRQILGAGSLIRPQMKKKWVSINTLTGIKRRTHSRVVGGLTKKDFESFFWARSLANLLRGSCARVERDYLYSYWKSLSDCQHGYKAPGTELNTDNSLSNDSMSQASKSGNSLIVSRVQESSNIQPISGEEQPLLEDEQLDKGGDISDKMNGIETNDDFESGCIDYNPSTEINILQLEAANPYSSNGERFFASGRNIGNGV
ncbi:Serine arginine-rich splicing factor 2 [Dionaea muscipula]